MKRKKKLNRRFLALFLAFTLCVGSVQMTAFADGAEGDTPQAAADTGMPDDGAADNNEGTAGTPENENPGAQDTSTPGGNADGTTETNQGTVPGTGDATSTEPGAAQPDGAPGADTGNGQPVNPGGTTGTETQGTL